MKIMILGASGMLGHKVFQAVSKRFPTVATMRALRAESGLAKVTILQGPQVTDGVDLTDNETLRALLRTHTPDVVVNCTGVIKQRSDASAAIPSIAVNSLLPHQLAAFLAQQGGRLITFSTDCVFNGLRGHYTEDDFPDALDLYGRTKFLGEVSESNTLTLRTSIIGRELVHFQSLLEWFLSQRGRPVRGFTRAIYSGVTTNHLAELVCDIIENHQALSGLYQVVSNAISKYDLLVLLKERFKLDMEIVADDDFRCDRSMNGAKLKAAIGYQSPSWPELVDQVLTDTTPYEDWR